MTVSDDDDGLVKIGNAYLMVRSPKGGNTHAINPKTKKTYCGRDMPSRWNTWRPTDQLPDDKHQPTCKICQRQRKLDKNVTQTSHHSSIHYTSAMPEP